jgi:hypothetical protein
MLSQINYKAWRRILANHAPDNFEQNVGQKYFSQFYD